MEDDIIICRCQEVTRQEILDAIADGGHHSGWGKEKDQSRHGALPGENVPAAGGKADRGTDGKANG